MPPPNITDIHLPARFGKIGMEDFPAFILVDDKGNDFFKQILH